MSEKSIFTGLILASGAQNGDPILPVLETLSPFSVKVLDSSLLLIRDRYIFSILVALNPDHARAISADLDALGERLDMDLAYDFAPHTAKLASMGNFECTLVGSEISAAALFNIYKEIACVAEVQSFESRDENELLVTRIEFNADPAKIIELTANLRTSSRDCHISLNLTTLSTQSIGNDAILLDMDSTFINEEVIDVLAEIAGVGHQVSAITERAMIGELDFEASLRERVRLLKGQNAQILDAARSKISLTYGAEELVRTAHEHGSKIGIVSGGFHDVIDELLAPLNLDLIVANRFEIVDGLLTGEVSGRIIDRQAKADILKEFAIDHNRAIAIGDGANDISMIQAADIGIAFNAKPALDELSDCGIYVRDLRVVAHLIGYR